MKMKNLTIGAAVLTMTLGLMSSAMACGWCCDDDDDGASPSTCAPINGPMTEGSSLLQQPLPQDGQTPFSGISESTNYSIDIMFGYYQEEKKKQDALQVTRERVQLKEEEVQKRKKALEKLEELKKARWEEEKILAEQEENLVIENEELERKAQLLKTPMKQKPTRPNMHNTETPYDYSNESTSFAEPTRLDFEATQDESLSEEGADKSTVVSHVSETIPDTTVNSEPVPTQTLVREVKKETSSEESSSTSAEEDAGNNSTVVSQVGETIPNTTVITEPVVETQISVQKKKKSSSSSSSEEDSGKERTVVSDVNETISNTTVVTIPESVQTQPIPVQEVKEDVTSSLTPTIETGKEGTSVPVIKTYQERLLGKKKQIGSVAWKVLEEGNTLKANKLFEVINSLIEAGGNRTIECYYTGTSNYFRIKLSGQLQSELHYFK